MRAMTTSTLALAREALAVGRRALDKYSCPKSKHDFTQPQLFALLTVRQRLRLDYRGAVALVAEWSELRRTLGLRKVPDHSTLWYAERRLLAGAEKGGRSARRKRLSSPAPPRADCFPPADSRSPWTPRASRPITRVSTTPIASGRTADDDPNTRPIPS